MAHTDRDQPVFSFDCADRVIFAIGVMIEYRQNMPVTQTQRSFLEQRAKSVFGAWPVHFVNYPDSANETAVPFTGYQITANCSAFPSDDRETIEKAILLWLQPSAELTVPTGIQVALAKSDWCGFAEKTVY